MASDTQMTGDEVYLHLPEVDMWDSTSKDLYLALDEGCNTTCHSEARAFMAETKLKRYGLDIPWISEQGKSFLGLGASTKTQGQRTIPFALRLKEGEAVPGTMDSHQTMGPQKTPLLLSLYAQASLGLVKNMKKGTVMMESNGKLKEQPFVLKSSEISKHPAESPHFEFPTTLSIELWQHLRHHQSKECHGWAHQFHPQQ